MSDAIFRILEKSFKLPEWVLVPQVRDGTGWTQSRTADAVAMNCYPSKGLEVYGFEFKSSRADWLRELKDGSKADAVAQHCDRWFIVAPVGVVDRKELPSAWGLMTFKEAGVLRTRVPAPRLIKRAFAPMDRSFVASFLRGTLERSKAPSDAALAAKRSEGWDAAMKLCKQQKQQEWKFAHTEAERLRKVLHDFQEKSGVQINEYYGGHCGEAFGAFRQLYEHDLDGLIKTAEHLRGIATALETIKEGTPKALRKDG